MNSKIKALILVIIVVVLVVIGLKFAGNNKTAKNNSPAPTPTPQAAVDNGPVKATSPSVTDKKVVQTEGVVAYNFYEKIKSMDKSGSDTTLTLDTTDTSVPVFTITKDTKILLINKGKTSVGALTDLKVGEQVGVAAFYTSATKMWTTTNVYISQNTPAK